MTTILRIPAVLHRALLADLEKAHRFAAERVAFCRVRVGNSGADPSLVVVTGYWSVPDDQYVDDQASGARINSIAIRAAMQAVLDSGQGIVHVHLHDHAGQPRFSRMDDREQPRLVQSLRNTNPHLAHGMLVLSRDSAAASVWMPGEPAMRQVDQISIVGLPMTIVKNTTAPLATNRFRRQSFLGERSDRIFEAARIGIIGLGGGGSHIAQQLAHVGFRDFLLVDPDRIDETNLNRLIGGTEQDVHERTPKVEIARRLISSIRARASVKPLAVRWQEALSEVRSCDIIFGGIDGFDERRQLEATCRRYLVPYIDIGMDVHIVGTEPPRVGGQIIASIPGMPCMQCLGFLNDRVLTLEAQRYGDAGDRPQVVWSNGLLASSAVGVAIDILTHWTRRPPAPIYLSYDGNTGTLGPHARLPFLGGGVCEHHKLMDTGDPAF